MPEAQVWVQPYFCMIARSSQEFSNFDDDCSEFRLYGPFHMPIAKLDCDFT